jgi:undecaprenyl-diphosphatase
MNTIQSIVLGAVQGFAEFLPISSTAHLRVIPALVGWEDPGAIWSAVVQMGTLAAVLVYFFRDLKDMFVGFCVGVWRREPAGTFHSRLAWLLIFATLPIGVAGLLFEHAIETTLRSLWVVSAALAGLALLLALAEWVGTRRRTIQEMGWLDGLIVGIAQALSLIPGSSRSGVTLTAGLFVGMKRTDAARFSFLLSVPAVAASGVYELLKLVKAGGFGEVSSGLLFGTLTAFVSGLLAISFLMKLFQKHSTAVFVVYRFCLAGLIVVLLSQRILVP